MTIPKLNWGEILPYTCTYPVYLLWWTRRDVFVCETSFIENAKKPALFHTYDFIPEKKSRKNGLFQEWEFIMQVSWHFSWMKYRTRNNSTILRAIVSAVCDNILALATKLWLSTSQSPLNGLLLLPYAISDLQKASYSFWRLFGAECQISVKR